MVILGLMSGTSLDGVDLALCNIDENGYSVFAADTVPYSDEWRQRLAALDSASAAEYVRTDAELGHLYGHIVNRFLKDIDLPVDAIASHGHTVFHQPHHGFTAQIGDGESIAAETGLPVVYNFRALDVALGGQGAPLVPVGDELFFGRYDACLNLGGIANISFRDGARRVAYDICPCNMALNRLAADLGLPYDPQGENARRGLLDYYLRQTLDRLDYYRLQPPKSLGKEWFVDSFWPVVEASALPTVDLLRTVTEHIAAQIADTARRHGIHSMLVTGGGALNRFLVECIEAAEPSLSVTVPDLMTVNYKEAIVFALLGYLRLGGRVNTLASVTGARQDSVGGCISGIVPNINPSVSEKYAKD